MGDENMELHFLLVLPRFDNTLADGKAVIDHGVGRYWELTQNVS
jgi:hypothetical protein